MLDIVLAHKLYDRLKKGPAEQYASAPAPGIASSPSYTGWLISAVWALYWAHASWACNTSLGVELPLKVAYAFSVVMWSGLYWIYYLIFRRSHCMF